MFQARSIEPLIAIGAFWALALMPLLLAVTRAGADITLGFIDIVFLVRTFISKDCEWLKQPEIKVLVALWLFMLLVSFATPVNPVAAFTAALIWGRFVLFYAAARFWLLPLPGNIRKINTIGLITIAFAAIDTAWQYKTGTSLTGHSIISGERLTGPLTKANIGNYLLKIGFPMLGMLSYRLMVSGQSRRLWIPIAALLVLISLIMVSGERSTVILLLLSIGVIGLTFFISQPRLRGLVIGAGVGIAALLALLVATQAIVQDKIHLFTEQMSDFWHTFYGQMYIGAWKLWLQNPLTGIGAHQYLVACKPEVLHTTYCDVHPHNMYVEWMVATGPGLLLFIAAMALIARRLLREVTFSGPACILTACALSQFAVLLFPFVVTQSVFANWSAILFWYSMSLGMSLLYLSREKLDD